jgi:hypothetical protein
MPQHHTASSKRPLGGRFFSYKKLAGRSWRALFFSRVHERRATDDSLVNDRKRFGGSRPRSDQNPATDLSPPQEPQIRTEPSSMTAAAGKSPKKTLSPGTIAAPHPGQ